MYIKIVHGKSTYFFSNHANALDSYTARNFSEMSALSVNNFAIDVNPLVRF